MRGAFLVQSSCTMWARSIALAMDHITQALTNRVSRRRLKAWRAGMGHMMLTTCHAMGTRCHYDAPGSATVPGQSVGRAAPVKRMVRFGKIDAIVARRWQADHRAPGGTTLARSQSIHLSFWASSLRPLRQRAGFGKGLWSTRSKIGASLGTWEAPDDGILAPKKEGPPHASACACL